MHEEQNKIIDISEIYSTKFGHPKVMLIVGERRSGKSALGYRILEIVHKEYPRLKIFVVRLPKEKHQLLPNWIVPINMVEDLPVDCVALVDEASLEYHAYRWGNEKTTFMERILTVSGQRGQTLIFITHTMKKFAINLLEEIDILLCKKPTPFHSRFERSGVTKLMKEVSEKFDKLPRDDVKNTYVESNDFKGFIWNDPPQFWSKELSEAYKGISSLKEDDLSIQASPKKDYPKDKAVIVHRVANRLGLVTTKNPNETIQILSEEDEEENKTLEYLERLVELGEKYCHEEDTQCSHCHMIENCSWFQSRLE